MSIEETKKGTLPWRNAPKWATHRMHNWKTDEYRWVQQQPDHSFQDQDYIQIWPDGEYWLIVQTRPLNGRMYTFAGDLDGPVPTWDQAPEWAMHLNIGQLGYKWDTVRADSPGYGWGHISARPESKE